MLTEPSERSRQVYGALNPIGHALSMAHYIYDGGLKLRQKVRAVITSATGEVLLIRPRGYAVDQWALAGGGVDAGESPVEAMRRELAEELGLECEEVDELPVQNRSSTHPNTRSGVASTMMASRR